MDDKELKNIVSLMDREWTRPWEVESELKGVIQSKGMSIVKKLGEAPLPTEYGGTTYLAFGDYTTGRIHDVIVFGDIERLRNGDYSDPLVRLHSACRSSELFHSSNCECRQELETAMKAMSEEKKGVILYMDQEGGGNGIAAKISALKGAFMWSGDGVTQRKEQQTGMPVNTYEVYEAEGYKNENRDFTAVGEILNSLGIKSVRLMTNNPRKITGVESAGIKVTPVSIHISPDNEFVSQHLKFKSEKLGHDINKEHWEKL
jgi:3,4-dihydroxy 2-butanone 4-phosphate synthase/GTP cyclohydrolase II